jgi:SAM-dependent methyltransferase
VSLIDVSPGTAYAGREANHALSFRQFNKSKHAQFFTPVWLAELLFEAFNPLMPPEGPSSISVLDPTCGSGRLLAPFKAAGAQVLGIELDQLAADHARFAIGNQNVRTGDLVDYRHLLTNFSLVVTNPPYGIYWPPPDAGEVWTCETSGGLLESQSATLEIATRSLVYGGYLVAIIPTSTFQNAKDRFLRDILYTQFEPVLQATLPNLFAEEYGIAVEVDLVIAKRTYRGYGAAWNPAQLTVEGEDGPGRLRYALTRALLDAPKLAASTNAPVPVLSRLLAITPSTAVRVTPKGLKGAADVDGLLNFLDETVTAFDPVRGIEHGMVSATLSPASLLTLGPRAGVESLAWLGFDPAISERDQQTISRLQEKYRILKTPIYPPEAHQRLATSRTRATPRRRRSRSTICPASRKGRRITSDRRGFATAKSHRSKPSSMNARARTSNSSPLSTAATSRSRSSRIRVRAPFAKSMPPMSNASPQPSSFPMFPISPPSFHPASRSTAPSSHASRRFYFPFSKKTLPAWPASPSAISGMSREVGRR